MPPVCMRVRITLSGYVASIAVVLLAMPHPRSSGMPGSAPAAWYRRATYSRSEELAIRSIPA